MTLRNNLTLQMEMMKTQIEEYTLSEYIELKAYLNVMFMLHDHFGGRHKIVDQTPLFLLPSYDILLTSGINTNNDTCFIMKYHKCSEYQINRPA